MHIHILGICGTFMGGIALIARAAGHKVTGSDRNVYPPMSTELSEAGITLHEGYDAEQLDCRPDLIVVGNVMKRGMPVIERMLNEKMPYVSGPQWLYEHYLRDKDVLAVAGTHGKTTTTAMLAWILEFGGLNPGFLIGGVPGNFSGSARATDSRFFVIEADEYDCAFFDKRSKFVHYHPYICALNNLEYDHADIFENVQAIEKQFHHLVRTVPGRGFVLHTAGEKHLNEVLSMGLWSTEVCVGSEDGLHAYLLKEDGSEFDLFDGEENLGQVCLPCCGLHNVKNALMAMAAARCAGVPVETSIKALSEFRMPKRRLELRGTEDGVAVYDDFAHHPTAITLTLNGLRRHLGDKARIVAVLDLRSNSMKAGANKEHLAASFKDADQVFVYQSEQVHFDVKEAMQGCPRPYEVCSDFEKLQQDILRSATPGSSILVMSNGSFNGLHGKLLQSLKERAERGI